MPGSLDGESDQAFPLAGYPERRNYTENCLVGVWAVSIILGFPSPSGVRQQHYSLIPGLSLESGLEASLLTHFTVSLMRLSLTALISLHGSFLSDPFVRALVLDVNEMLFC